MTTRRRRHALPIALVRALVLAFAMVMAAAAIVAFGVLSVMIGH